MDSEISQTFGIFLTITAGSLRPNGRRVQSLAVDSGSSTDSNWFDILCERFFTKSEGRRFPKRLNTGEPARRKEHASVDPISSGPGVPPNPEYPCILSRVSAWSSAEAFPVAPRRRESCLQLIDSLRRRSPNIGMRNITASPRPLPRKNRTRELSLPTSFS